MKQPINTEGCHPYGSITAISAAPSYSCTAADALSSGARESATTPRDGISGPADGIASPIGTAPEEGSGATSQPRLPSSGIGDTKQNDEHNELRSSTWCCLSCEYGWTGSRPMLVGYPCICPWCGSTVDVIAVMAVIHTEPER